MHHWGRSHISSLRLNSDMNITEDAISIYVHLPYCIKKCPYCDFNSYGLSPTQRELPHLEQQYLAALLAELETYTAHKAWAQRRCESVFFGGGTPSLFQPASIQMILDSIKSKVGLTTESEITIECNPGTLQEALGEEKIRGFLQAGVNRISLGAQSFNNKKLQTLGRLHSGADTLHAISLLRQAGVSNFNIDLMFGAAGETPDDWREDLQVALAIAPQHISLYGLTIEPGTQFFQQAKRGVVVSVPEDVQALMFEDTQRALQAAGYLQYEISNFSLPHYQCRHNMRYWQRLPYLGLGAGAHSFAFELKAELPERSPWGLRWMNERSPEKYIASVSKHQHARSFVEHLTQEQAQLEFLMLGLRLGQGICLQDYEAIFKSKFQRNQLGSLESEDLVLLSGQHLSLTSSGMRFANSVISRLAESI